MGGLERGLLISGSLFFGIKRISDSGWKQKDRANLYPRGECLGKLS
jgi:hypothetical protein